MPAPAVAVTRAGTRALDGRAVRSRRSVRAEHAHQREPEHEREHREDAERQHRPVGVDADVGIRTARDAGREQGGQADRGHHREQRAPRSNQQSQRRRGRDPLDAGNADGAQRRAVDVEQCDLAVENEPDRDRAGDRDHGGDDPEREREDVDRVARAFGLDRQALGVDDRLAEHLSGGADDLRDVVRVARRAHPQRCAEHTDLTVVLVRERA